MREGKGRKRLRRAPRLPAAGWPARPADCTKSGFGIGRRNRPLLHSAFRILHFAFCILHFAFSCPNEPRPAFKDRNLLRRVAGGRCAGAAPAEGGRLENRRLFFCRRGERPARQGDGFGDKRRTPVFRGLGKIGAGKTAAGICRRTAPTADGEEGVVRTDGAGRGRDSFFQKRKKRRPRLRHGDALARRGMAKTRSRAARRRRSRRCCRRWPCIRPSRRRSRSP